MRTAELRRLKPWEMEMYRQIQAKMNIGHALNRNPEDVDRECEKIMGEFVDRHECSPNWYGVQYITVGFSHPNQGVFV